MPTDRTEVIDVTARQEELGIDPTRSGLPADLLPSTPQEILSATMSTIRRITVRMAFIHEVQPYNPNQFEATFESKLESDQDSMRMPRIKVGADKMGVQLGMIKDPHLLVVKNATRWLLPVQPSLEEAADILKRVVVITLQEGSVLKIHPGEAQPLLRYSGEVTIHCEHGEATVEIFAVPR